MKLLLNKKAAMFGLDARIALAIFGALSVISGAALYSAIQNAKIVKFQTYFSELNKASEAYYLDTGRQIPITSSGLFADALLLAINALVINENNVTGWKGPYWQATEYKTGSNDYYIKDSMTTSTSNNASTRLWLKQTSNWDSSINSSIYENEICALNSKDCAEWFSFYIGTTAEEIKKIFNLLDEKVDGGDGAYEGNIRYSTYSTNFIFAKGRPRVYKGV